MKHIIKLFSSFVFILLIGSFSNNAVAQVPDFDHATGYECLEPPLGTMTTKDCFSVGVPDDDLAYFCLYGHKTSNVYITKPVEGLGSTTTLCSAAGCTAEMTTHNKFMKGDGRVGPPNSTSRPTPTAPDPARCNPVTAFFGTSDCSPRWCPCTNIFVVALWRNVCLGRQKGGKG